MKWIICAVTLLLITGCAIKPQMVHVDIPDVRVNPQKGPLIEVGAVKDDRQSPLLSKFPASTREKNVGGMVRGGNGFNVMLESATVTGKTRSIIVQALRKMGYHTVKKCQESCTKLIVLLKTFEVKAPFNFWRAMSYTQHMVANISVSVTLHSLNHTSTFTVSGYGSNIYQVIDEDNWETALDRAVESFSHNFQQAMASHAR